jgi:hypothetical protein
MHPQCVGKFLSSYISNFMKNNQLKLHCYSTADLYLQCKIVLHSFICIGVKTKKNIVKSILLKEIKKQMSCK